MNRRFDFYTRTNQFIVDGSVVALAFLLAYLVRFEQWPQGENLLQFAVWLPIVVGFQLLVCYARGSYRLIWRFVSLADALQIAWSIAIVTGSLLFLRLLAVPQPGLPGFLLRLPVGVIIPAGLLSLTGALGARALRRLQHSRNQRSFELATGRPHRRILLYGAGRAGQLLRRELESDPSVTVLGFLDDDPQKINTLICGTPVLGSGSDLPSLVTSLLAEEVVISMATASRQTLIRILSKCREADVPAKIVPSIQEILSGEARIGQIRAAKPEDLLGRDRVEISDFFQYAAPVYGGRRIMVTGAGGSIGGELARQLAKLGPARLALLDKDENSVYELEQELNRLNLPFQLEPQIADLRNPGRLRALFRHFQPHVVFHAAAHKHVPLMELHPCEAILNNVCGSTNIIQMAQEFDVERFVFVSSDKAVYPANVMGATKRIGEMLVQSLGKGHRMRSACVRFGNVLGSRGSVLPLFQKQIAEGGPVTITHADAVRYFMTISEAVNLILCAGTLADRGDIFVLDMGNPRNILELAHEMILLAGLEPGRDVTTKITGLRPGEKLFEELTTRTERTRQTHFNKLWLIEPQAFDESAFLKEVAQLVVTAERSESSEIHDVLSRMEIGYTRPILLKRAAAAAAD